MAAQEAEARAKESASRWIRPPFAIAELDFLLNCTRCDACIESCPHDVLFPLPAKFGLQVAATPAMDLLNKGCHLCADWPCVNACEPKVLKLPDTDQVDDGKDADEAAVAVLPPVLAAAAIDTSVCLPYLGPECGACAHSCPVSGALIWDGAKPRIDPDHCTGCALCREACIATPKAVLIQTLARAGRDHSKTVQHAPRSKENPAT